MSEPEVDVVDENGKPVNKRRRISFEVISIIYILLGLFLLIKPDFSVSVICSFVGILCLVYCVIGLVEFFVEKSSYASPSFFLPVVSGIVGLFFLFRSDIIVSILPFILGVVLVISGALKLQDGVMLLKMKTGNYQQVLVFGIVSLLLGILMVFNPFGTGVTFIRIAGIALIIDGVFNLYSSVMKKKLEKM